MPWTAYSIDSAGAKGSLLPRFVADIASMGAYLRAPRARASTACKEAGGWVSHAAANRTPQISSMVLMARG